MVYDEILEKVLDEPSDEPPEDTFEETLEENLEETFMKEPEEIPEETYMGPPVVEIEEPTEEPVAEVEKDEAKLEDPKSKKEKQVFGLPPKLAIIVGSIALVVLLLSISLLFPEDKTTTLSQNLPVKPITPVAPVKFKRPFNKNMSKLSE